MGDEFEGETVIPSGNQDELIIQQQRQIEREISESIALVGELEPIVSLNDEYSTDTIYLDKIKDLSSKYKFIRRTRPDGNCFFRAFTYAKLERLLENKTEFASFYKKIEDSKSGLVELGFPQFTVEDFYDTFIDVLKRLRDIKSVSDAKNTLHTLFNEQGYSDYMVVYLRLLTSGQLQKDQAFYNCFIEGDRTVVDFCHQEVEPMYKESDHIHIMAACAAMDTGVRVVYMDRGNSKTNTEHDLPEGSIPSVHLLYRPGHYDILYFCVFATYESENPLVKYYLSTRDIESVELVPNTYREVHPNNPTKIIIHGYVENFQKVWLKNMTTEYLKKGDFNVIRVDWEKIAWSSYPKAVQGTQSVGFATGDLIIMLHKDYGLNLDQVHIIGHSLGAHVAGYAGKIIKSNLNTQIFRITALDAARPLFEGIFALMKGLTKEDAKIVDAIHTDSGVFGRVDPIGIIDFYPNGGFAPQPGCSNPIPSSIYNIIFCSHQISFNYFSKSINQMIYRANKCDSWFNFTHNKCKNSEVAVMGDGYEYSPSLTGTFFIYIENDKKEYF
ncbi:hypothetical protein FQA39_LY15862 [Lamprigera yunnana]|nr:hypothetical protein FQA39_LY15862 [Lamprigera yunnana]